jgi:hypothetical protein
MEVFVKKLWGVVFLTLFAAAMLYAAPAVSSKIPDFPKTLINARFVYVTSYDGNQFRPQLLDQDRQAISNVQDALQKWGHFIIVYKPSEADMVIAVQSRGTEDVLAVYDPAISGNYLWRVMGPQGLQKGETPFVTDLQKAYERASK